MINWKLILNDNLGERDIEKCPLKGKISTKIPIKLQNVLKTTPKKTQYQSNL